MTNNSVSPMDVGPYIAVSPPCPKTTLVLASRIFQPLDELDPNTNGTVIAFGATPIALRAESLGAKRKPLETTRATLLALSAEPDTEVVMFCARDPETKQVTEGMAGIQHLLTDRGIPFRVVSSPFPSRICALLTEFDERVAKAVKAVDGPGGVRKRMLNEKMLALAKEVIDERGAYQAKLEAGKDFMVGDDKMDAKYCNWIRIYTSLCDALERTKAVLK